MKNAFWLFAIAILILFLFLPTFSKKQQLLEKINQYERDIVELKKKNIDLTEEKRRLEEDPVYRERVARERLGIVRDGEVIYRIDQVPVGNTEVEE